MSNFQVTVGWTISDVEQGYSSFDGYKPDAEQHTESFEVEWDNAPTVSEFEPEVYEYFSASQGKSVESIKAEQVEANAKQVVEGIGEACFEATNSPYAVEGLASQIRVKIYEAGYQGEHLDSEGKQVGHYSLSVGDTVSVKGYGSVACDRFGWESVVVVPVSEPRVRPRVAGW